MRVRLAITAALGLALTLTAVGSAAGDPGTPAADGRTVCGVFSQPLYAAEQAAFSAAEVSGAYKGLYARIAGDPTEDSFAVGSAYSQWQQAYAAYDRAKLAAGNTYAAQNAALCTK